MNWHLCLGKNLLVRSTTHFFSLFNIEQLKKPKETKMSFLFKNEPLLWSCSRWMMRPPPPEEWLSEPLRVDSIVIVSIVICNKNRENCSCSSSRVYIERAVDVCRTSDQGADNLVIIINVLSRPTQLLNYVRSQSYLHDWISFLSLSLACPVLMTLLLT